MTKENDLNIEHHPWQPFLPDGVQVLMLGTFPPGPHRWSMNFYYPNRANDFWKISGLIFEGDSDAYVDAKNKTFHLDEIKRMLTRNHIGLADSAVSARRLKGNASDKFLEIVEVLDIQNIVLSNPTLRAIGAAGEKASQTLAEITGTSIPKMGEYVTWHPSPDRELQLWRLPSSSRAYPLPLADKALYYENFYTSAGIELNR